MRARTGLVAATIMAGLSVMGAPGVAGASGTNSGGVNSGGVNTGGGGGTVSGTPCAQVQGWSVTAGQTPGDRASGAVWSSWTVKNCSTGAGSYHERITYTNLSTGVTTGGPACSLMPISSYGQPTPMSAGQGISCKLDNDFLPLATGFQVEVDVFDTPTGALLASQSSVVTTPLAQGV